MDKKTNQFDNHLIASLCDWFAAADSKLLYLMMVACAGRLPAAAKEDNLSSQDSSEFSVVQSRLMSERETQSRSSLEDVSIEKKIGSTCNTPKQDIFPLSLDLTKEYFTCQSSQTPVEKSLFLHLSDEDYLELAKYQGPPTDVNAKEPSMHVNKSQNNAQDHTTNTSSQEKKTRKKMDKYPGTSSWIYKPTEKILAQLGSKEEIINFDAPDSNYKKKSRSKNQKSKTPHFFPSTNNNQNAKSTAPSYSNTKITKKRK